MVVIENQRTSESRTLKKAIDSEEKLYELLIKHWGVISQVRNKTEYPISDIDNLRIIAKHFDKYEAGRLIKATDEEYEELKKVPEDKYEDLLKETAEAYQTRVRKYDEDVRNGELTLEKKDMFLKLSHAHSMFALEIFRALEVYKNRPFPRY